MTAPIQAIRPKRTIDDLALFGGPKLFDRPRPTGQLVRPDEEAFIARARAIYEARRLTNDGPFAQRLEQDLAEFHRVAHCIAFANACFAIVLALRAIAGSHPRGEVVLPSFSYRGLPHLVRWTGLEPRYAEVKEDCHTLDVDAIEECITARTVAILAVNNVNGLCDVASLERVAARRDIALLIDSVYALNGRYSDGRPVGCRGAAEVFSLHATKLLNGFEGGYLTTNDAALAKELRSARNFGFAPGRTVEQLGLNAKLNEMHAAMALSNLPGLPQVVERNRSRLDAYGRNFAGVPGVSIANYDQAPENYCLVLLKITEGWPFSREETISILRSENAFVRPHFSPPLHHADLFLEEPSRCALPLTDRLAKQFIQMPVGDHTFEQDIAALADVFRFLSDNKDAVGARLRQGGAQVAS